MGWGICPPPFIPKVMINVLKLDQIWQFQHKNGKKTPCIFFTFLPPPPSFLLLPFATPPQKKFDAGATTGEEKWNEIHNAL